MRSCRFDRNLSTVVAEGRLTNFSRLVFGLLAVALVSACATKGGKIPYSPANFGAPDALTVLPATEAYRIGPSDILAVNVFGVPEYSNDFLVDSLGRIQLPLVGNLPLTGRTPDEAAQDITAALDKTFLRNPRVQVQIKVAASQRVTVDGSVGAPGVYPIGTNPTLLQAVALAKGTTDGANPRRTVIFRTINGQRMAAAFDLTDIRRGISKDPEVFANDIIVVDGNANLKTWQLILQTIPLTAVFAQLAL